MIALKKLKEIKRKLNKNLPTIGTWLQIPSETCAEILASSEAFGWVCIDLEDVTKAMGKPSENISFFERDDSWDLGLIEFVNGVRGKDKIINGTLDDAYKLMNLIDDIYNKKLEL